MSYPPSSYPPPGGEQGGGKTKVLSLDYNIAAMICYLPLCCLNIIMSIVVLVTEPKESRFVRFHALQSLFLYIGVGVIYGVLFILASILVVGSSAAGNAGQAAGFGVIVIFWLLEGALGIVWLICVIMGAIKAYKYEMWKMPIIGNLAEKMA
jgi:uncharacterized membrane protein